MGIGDFAKKALFKPEDVVEEAPPPSPAPRTQRVPYQRQPSVIRTTSVLRPQVPAPQAAEDPASKYDAEMASDIDRLLQSCKSPGYAELQTQLQVLESVPDEGTRISLALATVQSLLKLPPEQVRAAVQERITALERHRQQTTASIQQEVEQTRKQYQQSLDTARTRIAQLEAELSSLQANAGDFESKLQAIDGETADVLARFEATFGRYYGELSGLLARIRQEE